MAGRPLNLLTRISAALTTSAILALGGSSPAAAMLIAFPPETTLSPLAGLFLVLFCLLALGLVFWMIWDRRRVKKRLEDALYKIAQHTLLLKANNGVSLVWDDQGHLSSPDVVYQWFGIDGEDEEAGLEGLQREDVAFSVDQFDKLKDNVERLLDHHESFRKIFFLRSQKRNIIVKGEPLIDGSQTRGAIVWFRDATIEENITAFQDRDARRINSRLDFFETTSNLIRFPMWMRNEALKIVWVNKAYVDAVDSETVEQVIEEGLELVTSSIGISAKDIAAISRDNHETYSEKHFVVIRGERRAVEIHNIPVQIDERLTGYLGYAQDITELEKAKGELIHHTESHSETLNKLSTAVAIFTSGKRLEYYNSAFSRLWHLPEGLLFSHPHHGEVLEAMREARRLPEQANFPEWKIGQLEAYTQILEPVEEMWHLPDNTSLRVVTQPHPLGGLLIFYEDVTDHFALERSYNTLFAVQRETLNNLHEGLAVFGIDGCLQLYNEAFADIWQLSRDMLDTNPHTMEVMASFAHNYGSSAQITELKDLIVGGEVKKEMSSGQLKRRDGSVLDYSAVPLPDGAMLITFIDVSDSFAIEKALRERNLALEETDKIKTEFLAHMSYELRNPLTSITGFAELLEREYQGPLNDVQHEYTHSILSASGQLLELINDILDLAVIEAGGMTLDIDQFELHNVMDQVIDQLQERTAVKEIHMVLDCQKDLKPIIGDARRIHHTIYNLLSNAIKFTPAQGTVSLTVFQDIDNYNIIVQDSGVGIPPEEVNKIFEKFFTGSNVTNKQGAGLGLSLVKSFVELHGGTIEVTSQLNVGTKVSVSVPLRVGVEAQISMAGE